MAQLIPAWPTSSFLPASLRMSSREYLLHFFGGYFVFEGTKTFFLKNIAHQQFTIFSSISTDL